MDSFPYKVVQHTGNSGEEMPHHVNVEKKSKLSKQETKHSMLHSDFFFIDKKWTNWQIWTGSIRTIIFVISLFCIQNLSHIVLYNLWK